MQYSWTKVEAHDADLPPAWGVRAANYGSGASTLATGRSGETVLVTAKSGKSKHVTLGAQIVSWNGGRVAVYAVAAQEKSGRPSGTTAWSQRARPTAEQPGAGVQAAVAAPPEAVLEARRVEAREEFAPRPQRDRKLTPSADAVRLPDGTFDAYDILLGTPGVPGRYRRIERGVEFLVDAWYPSWWPIEDEAQSKPGFDTAVECAMAWLAEEGRVLNEQIAYERANGWSTD